MINFIKKAVQDYNAPDLPIVFNLHFGHTDPQLIIPNGRIATIDGTQKKIFFD